MALTLEVQQRLEKVGLSKFYDSEKARWERVVKQCYEFTAKTFPIDAKIRADDVAQILIPILSVDEGLKKRLATGKLKQKYWISDFADLVLDKAKDREWWK
ncbi:MAG: hypothetical protein ACKVXR_15470 [Planctomycetota bacterium]